MRTSQDVGDVRYTMSTLPCTDATTSLIGDLVRQLSIREDGFVICHGLCVEIERERVNDVTDSLDFLASVVSVAHAGTLEVDPNLAVEGVDYFQQVITGSKPFPECTTGLPCATQPNLFKAVPLSFALRYCVVGKPYGYDMNGYVSFRRDLENAKSGGGLAGFILVGSGDRSFFVTTKSSVEEAMSKVPAGEKTPAKYAERLRDLLGLWWFKKWRYAEIVTISYGRPASMNHTPRTATFFDAGGRLEYAPHVSADGWGLTIDARDPMNGVAEAIADSRLGGACILDYVGKCMSSSPSVLLDKLNERLRAEHANAR